MGKVRTPSTQGSQPPATETSPALHFHPSRAELSAMGKSLRNQCPRQAHVVWRAPERRPEPLQLLAASSQGRIPKLLPVRYGRNIDEYVVHHIFGASGKKPQILTY